MDVTDLIEVLELVKDADPDFAVSASADKLHLYVAATCHGTLPDHPAIVLESRMLTIDLSWTPAKV